MIENRKPLTECSYMAIPGHIQFSVTIMDVEKERKAIKKNNALLNLLFDLCEFYEVPYDEFLVNIKLRKREYITIRQIYCYILRKETTQSLLKIGSIFSCDHSTVINSIKKVEEYLFSEPEYKLKLNEFKKHTQKKRGYLFDF